MKTAILLLLVIFMAACNMDNTYTIHGSFTEVQEVEYIWLQKLFADPLEIDSVKIIDGEFTFTGEVDIPGLYALAYPPQHDKGVLVFILEAGDIDISIDPESWFNIGTQVTGAPYNEEYNRIFTERNEKYMKKKIELMTQIREAGEDEKEALNKQMAEISESENRDMIAYIEQHPDSPVSLHLLMWTYFGLSFEDWGHALSLLTPEMQQSPVYKRMESDYQTQLALRNTTPALEHTGTPSFIEVDFKGKSIISTLAEMNPSKVMYVDVWGTTCGPCLKEFPHSRELHAKVDPEHILFVYLCTSARSEEDWKTKIRENDLGGQHFLLNREIGKAFYEELGERQRNPYYFIIGKDGELAMKNAPRPSSSEVEELLNKLAN